MWPSVFPLTGYGPYNAMQINRGHGLGAINADKYVRFAMEARLLAQCKAWYINMGMMPVTSFDDPLPG